MISSEEFQQKLQAGRLHEALALVVRDTTLLHRGFAHELDVTTRLTQELASESSDRGYLRTKINLLTGDIQNEVGKDVVTNSSNYLKLQKLHIDQIVASHRIVQGYLDRFKAILTVLAPSIHNAASQEHHPSPILQAERMDTDTLVARLHEAKAPVPIDPDDRSTIDSIAGNGSKFSDEELSQLAINCDRDRVQWQPLTTPSFATERKSQPDRIVSLVEELEPMDDEIDLSIDEDGAVWEEWVEDEDFMSESSSLDKNSIDLSSASPAITLPDRDAPALDPRQLHPIELKPALPRIPKRVTALSAQWDKFEPEYLNLSDCQPLKLDPIEAERIERLLSLDKYT